MRVFTKRTPDGKRIRIRSYRVPTIYSPFVPKESKYKPHQGTKEKSRRETK